MYCDECGKQKVCEEKRKHEMFMNQFELCVEKGYPDWREDSYFSAHATETVIVDIKQEEVPAMGKKKYSRTGVCDNCKREITIQASGLCSVCCAAARGKGGEVRSAALQSAKERILAGNLRGCGKNKKSQTGTKPVKAAISGKEPVTATTSPAPEAASIPTPEQQSKAAAAVSRIANHGGGIWVEGNLLCRDGQVEHVIPVTLRLTVEIDVRMNRV